MPLRERYRVSDRLADCVFAGRNMARPVPKYRFPRGGPVQVVWHKFARYWDIEMREVPKWPSSR